MSRLAITHETRYEYDREVSLGEWRLMLRPTDSHALRVVSADLQFSPEGSTRWAYDAFGNSVCYLNFAAPTSVVSVKSHLVVDRFPNPVVETPVAEVQTRMPVLYDTSDLFALAPLIRPVTEDRDDVLRRWIRSDVLVADESALELLGRLNRQIHDGFAYNARYEEGVQAPDQTLVMKSGTCRDFAWLMIETARRLGFAARFASGYVGAADGAPVGGGSTHAWCEVFLPSLGWVEFDPTNALTESPDLIRVASTRTPEEASPMRGTIFGDAASALYVSVDVRPELPEPALAN